MDERRLEEWRRAIEECPKLGREKGAASIEHSAERHNTEYDPGLLSASEVDDFLCMAQANSHNEVPERRLARLVAHAERVRAADGWSEMVANALAGVAPRKEPSADEVSAAENSARDRAREAKAAKAELNRARRAGARKANAHEETIIAELLRMQSGGARRPLGGLESLRLRRVEARKRQRKPFRKGRKKKVALCGSRWQVLADPCRMFNLRNVALKWSKHVEACNANGAAHDMELLAKLEARDNRKARGK